MSSQDYIYCYQGKALRVAGSTAVIGKSIKLYYDFGDQYTLVTNTTSTIDLSNTKLSTANSKYVVFFQEIICTDSWGDNNNGISYGPFGYTIGDGWATGFKSFPSLYVIDKYPQTAGSKYIIVLESDFSESKSKVYDLNFKAANYSGDYTGNLINTSTINQLPSSITSISTNGMGQGKLRATSFKAAGFSDLSDINEWVAAL